MKIPTNEKLFFKKNRPDESCSSGLLLVILHSELFLMLLKMLFEQVATEIAVEFAEDRVHVIGVVLGVGEFNQENLRLNAVVMEFPPLLTATPGEVEVVAIPEVAQVAGSLEQFGTETTQVSVDQFEQHFLLFGVKVCVLNPFMLNHAFVDDRIVGGEDFFDHTFCQQFFYRRRLCRWWRWPTDRD